MAWIYDYVDHPLMLSAAGLIAIPLLRPYWKWLFFNRYGFLESLKDAATPDWYAFWRGRYRECMWAEVKVGLFALLYIAVVAALYAAGRFIFF